MASHLTEPLNKSVHAPDSNDALARLTSLGQRRGTAVMLAALMVSFFATGYFVIYWRSADMDFMVVHSALGMNDGLPQYYFDHPGYLTILSVKYWYQALHAVGLLDAYRLSALPPITDPAAVDTALTHAIRAGRLVSLITALAAFGSVAFLMRRLVHDWRIATLATFAFVFSGGFADEIRILRTELVSASAVVVAVLLLILVGRKAQPWRPFWLGVAALLCTFALMNKVQAVLLVAALPVMLLPFGNAESKSAETWRRPSSAVPAIVLSAILAALLAYGAYPLVSDGLDPANVSAMGLRPLVGNRPGLYQAALVSWITLGVVVHAWAWRIVASEVVASLLAIAAGTSLALLAFRLQFDARNVVVSLNPIEQLVSWGTADLEPAADRGGIAFLSLAASQVGSLLARYTFVLHSSPRPTIFLIWFIVPAIGYAWIKGARQVALQAAVLMFVAFAMDLAGMRRGLKMEYFLFSDPFIILAGAILLDRLTDLARHRLAYPIGLALLIAHATVSQAEPVKLSLKRGDRNYICSFNQHYFPRLPLYWCPHGS